MAPKDVAACFMKAHQVFEKNVQAQQLMCQIYSAYAGPRDENHNCLGCNFDGLTSHLNKFLRQTGQTPGVFLYEESFASLCYLVNSIWERISDIFKILSLPESYKCRHYQTFVLLRRWANFFKHPKEFGWLVHHPIYCIEGSSEAAQYTAEKVII